MSVLEISLAHHRAIRISVHLKKKVCKNNLKHRVYLIIRQGKEGSVSAKVGQVVERYWKAIVKSTSSATSVCIEARFL